MISCIYKELIAGMLPCEMKGFASGIILCMLKGSTAGIRLYFICFCYIIVIICSEEKVYA